MDSAELPAGWRWATIGEVTVPADKHDPSRHPDKEFVYLDISSIDNTRNQIVEPKYYHGTDAPSRARQVVRANDVLFSTVRTYLRNIALVTETYDGQIASTGFCVLRGNADLLGKYLFHYVLTNEFLEEIGKLQRGVSYPAVRDDDVRNQLIPLPPLPVQKQIVDAIETQFTRLDTAEAALKRVQANLRRYQATLLKAACEGRLVPTEAELAHAEERTYEPAAALLERILAERRAQWQAEHPGKKYKEPAGPDLNALPELPEGWCWATVEQVGQVTGGLTKNSRREQLSLRMPYLRVANVYANRLELNDIEQIGVNSQEIPRILLKEDDLLVVEGNGSPDQIGRVAIWNGSISPCLHQNHLIKIRLVDKGQARYVLYWLLSSTGREYITRTASSTSGLYTLSLSKVESLPVPLAPAQEQERIVAEIEQRLSVARSTEHEVERNIARANRLRQSILADAFSRRLS